MSDKRPIIMYVDDEPHNLAVFEASMPDEWKVLTYDNPVVALQALSQNDPCLIVSDQRMPGMMGVQFLEVARQLKPNAIRIIVTGYSDEELVVESVRKAQIFDYIKKPWEVDDLIASVTRGIEFHRSAEEARRLQQELVKREQELRESNVQLKQKSLELEQSISHLSELTRELHCWVPPAVTWLARHRGSFPVYKDLALLAIDIIGSGSIHGKIVGRKSLRALALEEFAMLVLKHGGYIESTEGDAAYANFGLTESTARPCDAALAVANEFRAALRGIASHHQETIECGIGLHFGAKVEANISEFSVGTAHGPVVQKRFYTSSSDIDLVHRMEKHVHKLPGSNIIMSQAFKDNLSRLPEKPLVPLGFHLFKGQLESIELFLIRSSQVTDEQLRAVIAADAA